LKLLQDDTLKGEIREAVRKTIECFIALHFESNKRIEENRFEEGMRLYLWEA
jgi:hypothetical protein